MRGLWSVNKVNSLPSNRNLKWRMAEKAARSSLSKAEYLTSAEESFLDKMTLGLRNLGPIVGIQLLHVYWRHQLLRRSGHLAQGELELELKRVGLWRRRRRRSSLGTKPGSS